MNTILAVWPIVKWALQALGFMGPEDKEAERNFQLKLMAAQEENRKALTEAFASFQTLWRPAADRVYVWANTLIALFQPTILGLVYYDVIFGRRRSIQVAVDLEKAGIPGLLIMAILLFPFYGPALVSSVGGAFQSAVDLAVRRRSGQPINGGGTSTVPLVAPGRPVVPVQPVIPAPTTPYGPSSPTERTPVPDDPDDDRWDHRGGGRRRDD